MKRKSYENESGVVFSTRESAMIAELIGHDRYHGNGFTHDEFYALARLYGITIGAEPDAFIAEGDSRDVFRAAEEDGLRVMAFLARYCERGEDPVKLVAAGISALGFDVPCGADDQEGADHE